MPTVFTLNGFRFFYYSNEGSPREPVHVHVRKAGAEGKIWLRPEVQFARQIGFDGKTRAFLLQVTTERRDQIETAWHAYFG
jgi:hypothetical protein